jgi:hypothetical protein
MLATHTGWTERFILWELPLERLVAYEHSFLRSKDVWTVRHAPITPQKLEAVAGFFDASPSEDDDDF